MYYLGTCLEGLRKTTKHLRIAGVSPEIRAGYLTGMSRALPLHQPYSNANMLRVID